MRTVPLVTLLLSLTAVPFSASLCSAQEHDTPNADIVRIAYGYEDGGTYKWKGSGVPEELVFAGEQILPKSDGTYCCGYTLAVVFKAAQSRGLLGGRTADDIRLLHKYWYGNTEDSEETLVVYALEELELGQFVELNEAAAGDFAQFWRSNESGHSVMFLEWIVEEGKTVGVKYRSSQKSTNGIGDRIEYFADAEDHDGKLLRDRFYVVRLNPATAACR